MMKAVGFDHPSIVGQSTKDGAEGTGYTIFKNTNKELVAKIKALDKPSDTWIEKQSMFNGGAKGKSKIDKKLNDKQFLCIDEHGHYFVKKAEDFESTNSNNLLDTINDTFIVAEHISEAIGPFYTDDGFRKIEFTSHLEQLEKYKDHENIDNVKRHYAGWGAMGRCSAKEMGVELHTYNALILTEGECGRSSMFCHFNEDGNISNRDYNFDLKYYIDHKPKGRKDLIEEIVKEIPEGIYENYGNKWFSSDFCFIVNKVEDGEEYDNNGRHGAVVFNVSKLEKQSEGKYGGRWNGKATRPKSAKASSRDHLLSQILPLVNQMEFGSEEGEIDLSQHIDFSKVPEKDLPKKRVQKTKIDEDNFTEEEFFDFTNLDSDEFDWIEDETKKELKTAIKDFSKGVDIGNNEDIILRNTTMILSSCDLPSFSFDKGKKAPNNDDFNAIVKYSKDVNLTFQVVEGDACEITNEHSIYYTEVHNLLIVE